MIPFGLSRDLTSCFEERFVEPWDLAGWFAFGEDAIDAAEVFALPFVEFHFVFSGVGKPVGVLDHVAIHVDDPEGSVGSGARHDGAGPAVFGGEEVRFVIGSGTLGSETVAVTFQDDVLDEIVKWFAGKGVHGFVVEEKVIAIDHGRTGAGVAAGVVETVESFLWL